ncbi:tol-pal system protein YbgF [Hyphomicrobium sp.]|uniref:tol-pal system protein YbgF n=1 Tax=Hyphomicrobium sp. TaxID=82 RepID=UPI0025C0506A|nr:tol-pal system protein YbgF [Hyphomicrobium sp.]MCC7253215.1 tol-pal system protein YbgF [Hyphomicrobium sp.]
MHSSKPFSQRHAGPVAAGALLAMLWCAGAALAQAVQSEQLPAVGGAQAQGKSQKGQAPSGGGDAGLRDRVEQLEGQLVDLQVVIGTLESLARTGGGGVAAAPVRSEAGGGMATSDRVRLDNIETQIRALTAQVEQLAAEVRAGGQRRSDAGGFGDDTQTSRFGSTTVTSDQADPMGGFGDADGGFGAPQGQGQTAPPGSFGGAAPPGAFNGAAPPPTYGTESLPPPGSGEFAAVEPGMGGSPKQLYETAYGHLLQQDYGAAQAGFRDFLKTYPQDPLAPNALYWLGESHYVQRNYADAAEAFDLVVSTYGNSSKAADAQLKRGMSLAQLGKRQDACSVLGSVGSKFASAPAQLKAKAASERQRIGCP